MLISWWHGRAAFGFFFLVLTLLFTPSLSAQRVRGLLLDSDTGLPIEGALVLLLDEAGDEMGGALSNDQGRFLLRAPGSGRYAVRAERIGFESVASAPIYLGHGRTHDLRLEMAQKAIELEGLRVQAERKCVVRPAEGLVLNQIWEEARKALFIQEWTEREGHLRFLVRGYERDLDPGTRWVVREDHRDTRWTSGIPIKSLPAGDLLDKGFIQPAEQGGFEFYGPDATVLLSDEFLDSHCFRLEDRDRREGMIGLSFEPTAGGSATDISGTLWLDRTSFHLLFLEFGYTRSPWPEAVAVAEGRIHFEEVPGGNWIVRRWWIRMPKMVHTPTMMTGGRSGLRVGGIVEAGGEVATVSSSIVSTVPELLPGGALRGLVWDSLRAVPLPGATVYLSGTGFSSKTDSSGSFSLTGLPEGFYRATFSHPRLDSIGVFPPGAEVQIREGRETEVSMATPSRIRTVEALCREVGFDEETSALVGTVRNSETGEVVPGAKVVLQWYDWRVDGGRELRANVRTLEVRTDQLGRYRACIRWGAIVTARAVHHGEMGPEEEVQLPQKSVASLDLIVGGHQEEGESSPRHSR